MDESMKVVIGADTSGAEAGLNKFAGALDILKKQLERLNKLSLLPNLDFKQQERIAGMIRKTSGEVDKMTAAMKRSAPGANSAAFAVNNLGRVVQDSSFGFIGIANNLNPLLESFQRLRAEAGSNAGALKLLGTSLMGAGGIGLALSAVTAILQFSQIGFRAWTGSATKAKEEADKFKESIKDVRELQDDAIASTQGQIATVQAFANVITDSNKPYADRKRALEELKETNKSYFGDLTLEASKLSLLTARVQEYTQAIIQEAIQKKVCQRHCRYNESGERSGKRS